MSDIKFLQPNWSVPSCVKALVSTRLGGVSKAPYESLNVGRHVNDREKDVLTNRHKLIEAASLPSEPIWLNQIHSTEIIELESVVPNQTPTCDGVITSLKKIVCAVMTADCLPLFLCDQAGTQVALLHAGWRGLADGIIEKGIALFNESPQNIIAWAGPCISVDCFEIGAEVREQLGGPDSAYRASSSSDKYYANLYQLTGERLAQLGVTNYSYSEYCSFKNEALFFSHRRDQMTGRMVSLIWIE